MTAAAFVYRLLLRLYPAAFRRAFATEMADAFAARLQSVVRNHGFASAAMYCAVNYLDAVRTAGAEWMTRSVPPASVPSGSWRLDLRHACRALARQPGYTTVVVVTLALAIGANTIMFSVVQAVLLNPLPFRDPDRIAVLGERSKSIDTDFVSPITFDDWRTRNEAFSEMAAFRYWETVNLEDPSGEPESINLVTATANFFDVLGTPPLLGRTFKDEQNKVGGSEAVISYELWTRRFHRNPAVLGTSIRIRGAQTSVVGVMPPSSLKLSLGWGDAWTCLYRYNVAEQRATGYRARYLAVVGRLKDGVSFEQARIRMETLQAQLSRESTSVASGYDVRLKSVRDVLSGNVRLSVTVLSAAVGLLLMIACANVANLMLARASARQRETAVRRALGAGTSQLVQLVIVESLLLCLLGAAIGAGLARAALVLIGQFQPNIPRIADASLTPGVLLATTAIAIVAALLCSVAPLLDVRRQDLRDVLNAGGRSASGGPAARRARSLLVASQMALASMLLVGGGLLFRSLENLIRVDPGFRATDAVLFDLSLPSSRYSDAASQTTFYRALTRDLSETPGVRAAGGLLYFVYRPKLWLTTAWPDGTQPLDGQAPVVFFNLVAGEYFTAMGIPLKAGRLPDAREMWDQPRGLVVNETLARQLYPTGDAIGKQLRTGEGGPAREIIGVVGDVRQKRLDEPAKPELYTTFSSMPMPFLSIVVRTRGEAGSMLDTIRGVVRKRDPGLAVSGLTPLDRYVAAHTSERRFAFALLGLSGVLAVGVGAIGLYGVVSYSVAQRRREIAIRLALGAVPGGVRSMVVRDALRVVGSGTAVGLAGAAIAGRFMQGLLFGVTGLDPFTYVVVPTALVCVALAASWIPALKASRVDAIGSLRGE